MSLVPSPEDLKADTAATGPALDEKGDVVVSLTPKTALAAARAEVEAKLPPGSYELGVYYLFTNQFKRAEDMLAPLVNKDARHALLYAMCTFFSGVSSYGEGLLDEALNRIWKAESVGKAKGDLRSLLVRADAYLLGSCVQFIQEKYVKGGWNLRKSWTLYDRAKKQLATYTGDNKEEITAACDNGVGLFNLLVSMLPEVIVRVVEWLGFPGDRALALTLLNRSFDSGTAQAPFAALFLLSYYVNLAEQVGDHDPSYKDRAKTLLEWSARNYPGGIFFAAMTIRFERARCQLERAFQVAETALDNFDEELKAEEKAAIEAATSKGVKAADAASYSIATGIKLMIWYQQGWIALLQTKWEKTVEIFQKLLEGSVGTAGKTNFTGMYAYLQALAAGMAGEEKKAIAIAAQVPKLQTSLPLRPMDLYVKRRAERMVAGNAIFVLDILEMSYNFGAIGHLDGELLEKFRALLIELPDKVPAKLWTPSNRARQELFLGIIDFQTGVDEASAQKHLTSAVELQPAYDEDAVKDGVAPIALYMLCRLFLKQSKFDEAQAVWTKCDAAAGSCDLSRIFKFRLHALNQTINMKKTAAATAGSSSPRVRGASTAVPASSVADAGLGSPKGSSTA